METLNDASGDIVNFFRVFRDNENELIRKIELTPWSTEEYECCRQPVDDPLERARRFYFNVWASIRPFDKTRSFRRQKKLPVKDGGNGASTPAARLFARTDHLYELAHRLRGVVIENLDALAFIGMYDYHKAFFYVDPPYPFKTRQRGTLPTYPVEFADNHKDERDYLAHKGLADTLNAIDGYAVVSGYDCDWYREFYEEAGWKREDKEARINGGINMVTESIWISPRTWQALIAERSLPVNLPLFAMETAS
jgi:DNA adenine methylase